MGAGAGAKTEARGGNGAQCREHSTPSPTNEENGRPWVGLLEGMVFLKVGATPLPPRSAVPRGHRPLVLRLQICYGVG